MKFISLLLFAVMLCACPQTPQNPTPDASDASVTTIHVDDAGPVLFADSGPPTLCTLACVNMNKLGCAEGANPNCVAICNHVQGQGITNLHPDCLANATSVAAIQACDPKACKK